MQESKKALRQDIFSFIESSRRHDEGYMVPRNIHGTLGALLPPVEAAGHASRRVRALFR